MKKIPLISTVILLALGLCSCSTPENNSSDISQTVSQEQSEQIQNNENIYNSQESETISDKDTDQSNDSMQGQYEYLSDSISASDLFSCMYYKKPEKINGFSYYISGVYHGKILTEVCHDKPENDEGLTEFGLYDPDTESFIVLTEHEYKYFMTCHDDRYFLFSGNGRLFCYDIENNETFDIFNTPDNMDRTNELPVILGKNVYFDAYIYGEGDDDSITPVIYEFDLEKKELSVMAENIQKPMAAGNDLMAFIQDEETGTYNTLRGLMNLGTEDYVNTYPLDDITCSGNAIFGLTSSDNGYYIKELKSGKDYLKTVPGSEDAFSNLISAGGVVSWIDVSGDANTPCVLDTVSGKIALFDKIKPCYYASYLDNTSGIILGSSSENGYDICIFSTSK